jgi:hypothetical protein
MIRTLASSLLPLALCAALPFAVVAKEPTKKPAAKPAATAAAAAPSKMTAEQAAMMAAYQKAGTPGEQHARLKAMEGDYDLAIKSWEGPGEPTVEKGTASRKMMLGDRVLAEHVDSQMHGQPFTGHGMSGYDNVSGKHWSTWNDSMGTGVMVSEGTCDAAGACTFQGSWNDAVTKGKVNARMTTRWTSPDVEVFEMYAPGPDGKEAKMMEITYTRRAK